MKANEFLSEANLSIGTFGERRPEYWVNLVDLIRKGTPIRIQIGQQPNQKVEVANHEQIAKQMDAIWNGSENATPDQIKEITQLRIPLTDGQEIGVQNIFQSPEIKGVSADYNIGDIGEIALGIAASARFQFNGAKIELQQFIDIGRQMKIEQIPKKVSMRGTYSAKIENGSQADKIQLVIALAARSMKSFKKFMTDIDTAPNNVKGTILSAIQWANDNKNINTGIEKVNATEGNAIVNVAADGVSDQKGTKADLFLHVNGEELSLISAKAGASQLGQASGIDFKNVSAFFNTVFGINMTKYKNEWTTSNKSNLKVLQKVYANDVIPIITRLIAGNNDKQEAELVKQVANGLIYYANNIKNDKPVVIDIVKLITTPTNPGYKLMRIGPDLIDAMQLVDLYGTASPSKLGIAVYGNINNQKMLLFKVRSYYSPAAKITRTIIEGGPLLDQLALVVD